VTKAVVVTTVITRKPSLSSHQPFTQRTWQSINQPTTDYVF